MLSIWNLHYLKSKHTKSLSSQSITLSIQEENATNIKDPLEQTIRPLQPLEENIDGDG